MSVDLAGAFTSAVKGEQIQVRSPHDVAWGYNSDKWTVSQEQCWDAFWRDSDRYEAWVKSGEPDPVTFGPRKAMVGGKGAGKCVRGETLVSTKRGLVRMDEARKGDIVRTHSGLESRAGDAWCDGKQTVYDVRTHEGYEIGGSVNHRVMSMRDGVLKWRYVKDLKPGDYVALYRGADLWGTTPLPAEDARLLGYAIAEGGLSGKSGCVITSGDSEVLGSVMEDADAMDYYFSYRYTEGKCPAVYVGEVFSVKYNLPRCRSELKEIPDAVLSAPWESVREFLRALFDGDGTADKRGNVGYTTTSKTLADQLRVLLLNAGIVCSTQIRNPKYQGGIGQTSYTLHIRGAEADLFFDKIGFNLERKQNRCRTDLKRNNNIDVVPVLEYLRGESLGSGNHAYAHYSNPGRERLKMIAERLNDDYLRGLVDIPYFFSRVESVEEDEAVLYDIHVPGDESFVANGVVNHNTFQGAMIASELVQKYPDSIGMFTSNTFPQLEKSLVPHFRDVCRSLGLHFNYHKNITIYGRPYSRVFVIHLSRNTKSFVCLTSFENIETIEGSEWDWQIFTELQDSPVIEGFKEVAITRLRGKRANRACFVDAMPENADHPQYDTLESLGFEIWEPSVFENEKNVGRDYIESLFKAYDKVKAQAYIYGKRISLTSSSVFHQFNYNVHQKGYLSRELCHYDPTLPLYITIDFNLEPMSASVWQPKPLVLLGPEYEKYVEMCGRHNIPTEMIHEGDTWTVLVQIDEFELWEGGTPATAQKMIEKYGNHRAGGRLIGDAAGRQRSTIDPGTTDWKLLKAAFAGLPKFAVIPGLIRRSHSDSRITYSNPAVRDTINRGNTILLDAAGRVRCVFLPKSKFESGGAARAVSRLKLAANGEIDKSVDKSASRQSARTHFADGFRYIAFDFTGGERGMTKASYERIAKNAGRKIKTSAKRFARGRSSFIGKRKKRSNA